MRVEPLTAVMASFVAVKSVLGPFVAVTVEGVELAPCRVTVTVPVEAKVAAAVVIAVAVDNGSVGAMLTHTSEIEEAKLIAWFDTIPALLSGYRDEL